MTINTHVCDFGGVSHINHAYRVRAAQISTEPVQYKDSYRICVGGGGGGGGGGDMCARG